MARITLAAIALCLVTFAGGGQAAAHCEVPCGIYTDQLRFESMLEDTKTIKKAMEEIQGLAGKGDAQSANQLVRWITTKEDHATKTQQVIAQYFMTQRIKADGERYEPKLKTAHAVMVQAMNCKQTTEPAEADQLKAAILAFHQAYEGKKK